MADKKKKSKQKDDRHKEEKQKTKRIKQEEIPDPVPSLPAATEIAHLQYESSATSRTDSAILDGAIACVTQYGVAGATTRRIAALAGVNEVTIFRRFGNKDTLLQAAFQREARKMENAALNYTGDLAADLARIVAVFVEATERGVAVLPMILNAGQKSGEAHSVAQHSVAQHSFAAFGTVAQVLTRYMQEGKLRNEAPERALAALVGPVVFGTLLQGALFQPVSSDSSALDISAHVQSYLDGRGIHAKQNS